MPASAENDRGSAFGARDRRVLPAARPDSVGLLSSTLSMACVSIPTMTPLTLRTHNQTLMDFQGSEEAAFILAAGILTGIPEGLAGPGGYHMRKWKAGNPLAF